MAVYWIALFVFGIGSYSTTAVPRTREVKKCSLQPIDIAFLLDSSETIEKEDFAKAKEVIGYIVDKMNPDSQIAVLSFNTNPKMVFNFKTLQNLDDVRKYNETQRLIKEIPGPFSETDKYIDRALEMANKDIFTEANGMRADVRKVAVVLTDGIQTKDKGAFTEPSEAAEPLKNKGVYVYAIGVGSDIDVDELLFMASTPNNIYWINSLNPNAGNDALNDILGNECPTVSLQPAAVMEA